MLAPSAIVADMAKMLRDDGAAGLGYAMIHTRQIGYLHAYGASDLADRALATDTPMHAASLTKATLATMAMQLDDRRGHSMSGRSTLAMGNAGRFRPARMSKPFSRRITTMALRTTPCVSNRARSVSCCCRTTITPGYAFKSVLDAEEGDVGVEQRWGLNA